ncbi:TIGR02646 family protein [Chlorobaculum thiosulfatiphilum]|jgi:uncharacterized protein (TIGR02646 family)|uniref:TIGR02646 family protein n=1 Tax=Chlorobaculum thiosulfatiphilum TaxID=115852 RepID=A0A5C4S8B0_CHLTI|nr:retron system putative HNH endonuclease [Chlorobaculum thiosulfatiphilum]NTW81730.1 TIGR02646 family protein [Geobacteraceae bacterium]TNJ39666.1 TIGR02646 family protein [Chlorobaculum thiosulfatiphilum]
MIPINKSSEPVSLSTYRSHPDALYNGPDCNGLTFTTVKQDIRVGLVKEQGYLCAYCMSRIRSEEKSMKVEHWQCRTGYPKKQLDYANLLGCCLGNKGSKSELQHCDTRKGDDDLLFNSAEPTHHDRLRIRYLNTGKIVSDDAGFDDQLNNVLNLNFSRLVDNRKAVWSAVTRRLSEFQGSASRKQVEELIAEWGSKDQNGFLKEYCGVALYYLKKRCR